MIICSSLNGNPWKIAFVTIFGRTILLMYLSSTIVHGLPVGEWKDIFQIFDHSSIFLFIASAYIPFLPVHLRFNLGWTLFDIVWGIAIIGSIFKIFFVKRFIVLSTLFYILIGWLIVLVWVPLNQAVHTHGFTLLIIGRIFYTVGVIFYMWRKIHDHHVIWNLFTLVGDLLLRHLI